MNLLYDKKVSCPNCKIDFTTKKPFSTRLKVDKIESDNHKIYKNINPYIYEINVCPQCGMAFGEKANTKLNEDKIRKILDYFMNINDFNKYTSERSMEDGIRVFKLALHIASQISEPKYVIAGLALKVAWLYRELEDTAMERKFLEISYQNYKFTYSNEDFESVGYQKYFIIYTIADLSRRLDYFEEARRWYGDLFALRSAVPRQMMIKATDMWGDYKEEHHKRELQNQPIGA